MTDDIRQREARLREFRRLCGLREGYHIDVDALDDAIAIINHYRVALAAEKRAHASLMAIGASDDLELSAIAVLRAEADALETKP